MFARMLGLVTHGMNSGRGVGLDQVWVWLDQIWSGSDHIWIVSTHFGLG